MSVQFDWVFEMKLPGFVLNKGLIGFRGMMNITNWSWFDFLFRGFCIENCIQLCWMMIFLSHCFNSVFYASLIYLLQLSIILNVGIKILEWMQPTSERRGGVIPSLLFVFYWEIYFLFIALYIIKISKWYILIGIVPLYKQSSWLIVSFPFQLIVSLYQLFLNIIFMCIPTSVENDHWLYIQ